MRKFASTIVAFAFIALFFLIANKAVGAPSIRILGFGRPSAHQLTKFKRQFNGERLVWVRRATPLGFNKNR
jgi:hypothetical protein